MKDKTEVFVYIIVNMVLILAAVMVVLYLYILFQGNKNSMIEEYDEQTNVIASIIGVEKQKDNTEANNNVIVIPLIDTDNQNVSSDNTEEYSKYFYNQLDEKAKIIYDEIKSNLDNMKSGDYQIKLSTRVSNNLNEDNGMSNLNISFQSAWDAIMTDKVDIFYINISKINLLVQKKVYGSSTTYDLYIKSEENEGYLNSPYSSEKIIASALSQLQSKKEEIINSLTGSNYNKILQVHDYLIDNIEYNSDNNSSYDIYGALINGKAVCEGYAESFKYIMDEIGIPCVLVTGKATNSEGTTESHEWNYVEINNKWYAVDVTWDDPIVKGSGKLSDKEKHKYFLVGANTINENHVASGNISNSGMKFQYPQLNEKDY